MPPGGQPAVPAWACGFFTLAGAPLPPSPPPAAPCARLKLPMSIAAPSASPGAWGSAAPADCLAVALARSLADMKGLAGACCACCASCCWRAGGPSGYQTRAPLRARLLPPQNLKLVWARSSAGWAHSGEHGVATYPLAQQPSAQQQRVSPAAWNHDSAEPALPPARGPPPTSHAGQHRLHRGAVQPAGHRVQPGLGEHAAGRVGEAGGIRVRIECHADQVGRRLGLQREACRAGKGRRLVRRAWLDGCMMGMRWRRAPCTMPGCQPN